MNEVCIKEFVRKSIVTRNGNRTSVPVATLYACECNGEILVGYSQFHKGKDILDKQFGIDVARDRAHVLSNRLRTAQVISYGKGWALLFNGKVRVLPMAVAKALPAFLIRCEKYFKQGKLTPWAAGVRLAMIG